MTGGAAVLALALLAQGAAPSETSLVFATRLPEGVPSVAGWERVFGDADFPDLQVRYEFHVRPARQGAYEVVRYRFAGSAATRYGVHEVLQWDVNGRDVRRYECVPLPSAANAAPCAWHVLSKDSDRYRSEAFVLLWIYGLHRDLLAARDRGELEP